ncbi:uncharacterized protein LOC128955854 [Oppia nitens]|uniref:uncharacterized protein LOC128955854 n=1 Tax=Oppia nitens TaxID=1686743 RepID=UPI0023DBB8C9|nr:uncharacterized protein LOC128955854 [Oppia nitens]
MGQVKQILKISSGAFRLDNAQRDLITIDLSDSMLTDNNIEINAFDTKNKQIELHLAINWCNVDGSYDGQYGIDYWPPSPPGNYSVVKCPQGVGLIRWKCMKNGRFDSRGPDLENCWLDSLLVDKIETINDVVDTLDILRKGWMNGTDSQRLLAASQLLKFIQTTAFSTNCYLNDTINTIDIVQPDPLTKDQVCQQKTKIGALIQGLEDNLIGDQTNQQQINTPILAFSLNPSLNNHQLYGKYVSISLKHNNRLYLGDDIKCVFWDFNHQKWSQDGCRHVISLSSREQTVCKCDHLTNFAVLMDTSGRETDSLTKNVLTLLFCSLSVICLILTIVIIIRKDLLLKLRKHLIVLNLCVCLLVADLLIMIGMDRNESLIVCRFISALLLYALLSAFLWMLLQSFQLFRTVYFVFNNFKAYGFFLFAYGMPVPIIIIGLFSVWNNEEPFGSALVGNDYFCWISSPKYPNNIYIFLSPAIIVLVLNFIFIACLIHIVKKVTKSPINKRQLFGFFLLVLNSGITWTLFVGYMNRLTTSPNALSFVFIILNGSHYNNYLSTKLQNYPNSDYDLYKAYSSISKLQVLAINLNSDVKHNIPDYAFISDSITSVTFNGNYRIENVGNYVFYSVKHIRYINIEVISVDHINRHAFQVQTCLQCNQLIIKLQSLQLNDQTVDVGVFDIKGRTVILDIAYNKFEFIDEHIFRPFLDNNPSNIINFEGNRLNCELKYKYRFRWLLNNKLSDWPLSSRIQNARCSNGSSIWDLNWHYCDYNLDSRNLYCESLTDVDIGQEFDRLDTELSNHSILFESLVWSGPVMEGLLPKNVFKSLQISQINFKSTNLQRIHTDAFRGTSQHSIIEWRISSSPTLLVNYPNTDYDLFRAFASICSLILLEINFERYISHEIPDYAFNTSNDCLQNSSQLKYILFAGQYNISRVGDYAFYNLTNLRIVDFAYVENIYWISVNAFQFNQDIQCFLPTDLLYINLYDSQLSDNEIAPGAFNIKCKTY